MVLEHEILNDQEQDKDNWIKKYLSTFKKKGPIYLRSRYIIQVNSNRNKSFQLLQIASRCGLVG
jgi:hypothetical protein